MLATVNSGIPRVTTLRHHEFRFILNISKSVARSMPRQRRAAADTAPLQDAPGGADIGQRLLGWVDRLLSR